MAPGVQAGKKAITLEQWEAKLAQTRIPKEDMNRLIMNFLVTEVRRVRRTRWAWAAVCAWGGSLTLRQSRASVGPRGRAKRLRA